MSGCGWYVDVLSVIGVVVVMVLAGWILYRILRFWIEGRAVIRQMYPQGYRMATDYRSETESEIAKLQKRYHRCDVSYADYTALLDRLFVLESQLPKKAKKP